MHVSESSSVQIIWDRYDFDMSIKADERKRRGQFLENSPEIKINSRDQVMPTILVKPPKTKTISTTLHSIK